MEDKKHEPAEDNHNKTNSEAGNQDQVFDSKLKEEMEKRDKLFYGKTKKANFSILQVCNQLIIQASTQLR